MPRHAAAVPVHGRVIPPPPPLLLDAEPPCTPISPVRTLPRPSSSATPSHLDRRLLPLPRLPTRARAACSTKCPAATSPPSTSSFDANSRDGQPDASLETFKRPRRAAGVKAEPFTYASACRVPEGGQGSARAGRPGGARRRRIRLQDSPARTSACTPGATTRAR
jgi:hypothetical protein